MSINTIAIRTVEEGFLADLTLPHQGLYPTPGPTVELEGHGDYLSEALYDLADQLEDIGQ